MRWHASASAGLFNVRGIRGASQCECFELAADGQPARIEVSVQHKGGQIHTCLSCARDLLHALRAVVEAPGRPD